MEGNDVLLELNSIFNLIQNVVSIKYGGKEMSKHMTSKTIMVVTILAIVGFGGYAFAGWGMDYDRHGRGHQGPGWHHDGRGGPGHGYMMGNLSDADVAALEKEREAFFKATEGLRKDIYAKTLALRSELAKENPDVKKAQEIQKEISDLEAKIDQEKIDHIIKMSKINPNAGRGYGSKRGRGYGGGYCWR